MKKTKSPIYQIKITLRHVTPAHLAAPGTTGRYQTREAPQNTANRDGLDRQPPARLPRRRCYLRRAKRRSRLPRRHAKRTQRAARPSCARRRHADLRIRLRRRLGTRDQIENALAADPAVHYPRYTAGARACPPEDCGGPPGYAHLLDILHDPAHEEHDELREWAREDFDPEAFDLDAINKMLWCAR